MLFICNRGREDRALLRKERGSYDQKFKEAVSILMLCAPVFIFTSGVAQLFKGAHVVVYRSDCRYLLYPIHFSQFMPIFSRVNRQNMKIKYENGRQRLLSAQKVLIERASSRHTLGRTLARRNARIFGRFFFFTQE